MSVADIAAMPPAKLVEIYIGLRDAKKAADAEFKKSMERTNLGMEKLEAILLAKLTELGCDSLSCDAGTVYRNTQNSATVEDKPAFREWVEATGNWNVVDMRANKVAVRELLDTGEIVPGVKYTSVHTVGVRRA
jgi:3-methyladenine DNA glycosylase AlkD